MDCSHLQPNTDTIWMETGMNHSSQWAELRAVWLVISHKSWSLILSTDSWAVLKGFILWLGHWEAEGWMPMNNPLWGQDIWKDIWAHLQEPEASSLSFTAWLIKHWYLLVIRKLMP